jgi:pilus assembly protein CpaF
MRVIKLRDFLDQNVEFLKEQEDKNKIDLHQMSYDYRASQEKVYSKKRVPDTLVEKVRDFLSTNHQKLFQRAVVEEDKRERLSTIILGYISAQGLTAPGFTMGELLKYLMDTLVGLKQLQPLIENEDITDINVNGPNEVYVTHLHKGEYLTDVKFTPEELYEVAMKIVNAANESLTDAKPYVDCRFPGMRINITLDEISEIGITLSIRKFAKTLRITKESFVSSGQGSKEMLDAFEMFVRGRMNILIAGATGSGKTELFKFLVGFVPDGERTLVLEDTAETRLKDIYPKKHIVPFECRFTPYPETTVDFTILLKNALRQNPDRIAVGETRGTEAIYMLEIFNTGHDGGFTTGHANSASDMVERLIQMCLRGGMKLDPDVIGKWVTKTFDIVIMQEKMDDGVRRITEVIELVDYVDNKVVYRPIFEFVIHNFEFGANETIKKIYGEHRQTGYIRLETAKRIFKKGISKDRIRPLLSLEDREVF